MIKIMIKVLCVSDLAYWIIPEQEKNTVMKIKNMVWMLKSLPLQSFWEPKNSMVFEEKSKVSENEVRLSVLVS